MKKMIIIALLAACPFSMAETVVDRAIKKAQEAGVDQYSPSEEAKAIAENGFKNRAELGADGKRVVENVGDTLKSKEFQAKQKQWREALSGVMGTDAWQPQEQQSKGGLPYSSRPILFISSSIPLPTLRNYAADLEKVNGVMVMRGFVGGVGEMGPTMKFIGEVLKVRASCSDEPCERRSVEVMIDPILFREYGVKAVPGFTVHGLTNLEAYCKGTETLNPSSVVVYGDNSIKYLADRYSREAGDALNPTFESLSRRSLEQ